MSSELGNDALAEASGLGFLKRQFLKPKLLPDGVQLSGQVAIITGGSSGLGFEASRQFLKLGLSHVVLAVRSQARGDAAAERLRSEFPEAMLSVWLLEMESYQSIQAFVDRCQTLPRIDIAILNAGLQKPSFTTAGETGHETTIQVNYLSTMLLAILLLPVLKSKRAIDATKPPVLSVVGSDLAYTVDMVREGPIIKQLDNPKNYSQIPVYSKSKLLLLLSVTKLAESVDRRDVLVNVTNPGFAKGTGILPGGPSAAVMMFRMIKPLLGRSVDVAASNYVHSTVILGKESHGSFTSDWRIKPYPDMWYTAEGHGILEQLWEETLKELEFSNVAEILKGMKE